MKTKQSANRAKEPKAKTQVKIRDLKPQKDAKGGRRPPLPGDPCDGGEQIWSSDRPVRQPPAARLRAQVTCGESSSLSISFLNSGSIVACAASGCLERRARDVEACFPRLHFADLRFAIGRRHDKMHASIRRGVFGKGSRSSAFRNFALKFFALSLSASPVSCSRHSPRTR